MLHFVSILFFLYICYINKPIMSAEIKTESLAKLFKQQANYLEENNILITYFSFLIKGERFYRFYFRNLENNDLFNEYVEDEYGKRSACYYDNFTLGLKLILNKVKLYLEGDRAYVTKH